MCSEMLRFVAAVACVVAAATGVGAGAAGQAARAALRFFPDDPISRDDDTAMDASGIKELELSESYDFLINTFASPGDREPIRAVNVNTLDEVPDSSWFTNRIGVRDLPITEIARGPNKFERLDAMDWVVVRGKSPGGFHPGFVAEHPGDPGQVYQLEVDPVDHPQMATGAELIGTLVYHALGYHVEDVYAIRVDPARITISDKATIRDASGRRRFNQRDLDAILRLAARDREGRVYLSATRFHEGEPVGNFQYHGTRSDDPNDIHPHEHRRELRANRVFSAWLAHDDSRAVNTLDLLVAANGRKHVRHYMYDFGATLGSATRFAEPPTGNHETYLDKDASLAALASLGLAIPRYLRVPRADGPPSAGAFDSTSFDPVRWKANYPNPAFSNMRPDDAFWGARLVARFSDEAIRAIVDQVRFDDPPGGRAHHPCADRASRRHRTRLAEWREPRRGSAPRGRRHADVRERGGRGGRRHARKRLHRELVEIRQRLREGRSHGRRDAGDPGARDRAVRAARRCGVRDGNDPRRASRSSWLAPTGSGVLSPRGSGLGYRRNRPPALSPPGSLNGDTRRAMIPAERAARS